MPSARWWLQNLTRVRKLTLERQADGTAATTVALRRGLSVERLVYLSPSVRLEYFLSAMAVLFEFRPEIVRRAKERIENRFGVEEVVISEICTRLL